MFETRDLAQPDPGIPAAGSAEECRRQPRRRGRQRVHVIGAGVMGGDIAAWCALRGFNGHAAGPRPGVHRAGAEARGELFEKRLREPEKIAAARARLRADVASDGVAGADVVIEAIFENLEAKRALYASLEPRMKPDGTAGDQHLESAARTTGRAAGAPGAPGGPALLQSRRRRCRWWRWCSAQAHRPRP